jgi:multidrug efflux pump subunit AcrA (membrane-fusion protein)
MFAEVRIITEQKENIVKVPADVLIRRFGETFVYVARDDGTAERRIVNPGIEIDNKLEITTGLAAGELVVYQGQNLLEADSPIRIIDTIEPLSAEDTIR